MPGTLISAGQGGGGTVTLNVRAGDSIAITGINFSNIGASGTCSDSQGNAYVGPIFCSAGGFGVMNAFATVARASGSLTINMLSAGSNYAYAQYRGAGVFDQASVLLQYYTPSDTGFPIGVGVGPFTYADTTVITFVSIQGGSPFVIASDTGDLIVNGVNGFGNTFVLARSATGPGNGTVQIKTNANAGLYSGQIPIVVITFSNAAPRPIGTPEQYAFRGGLGFEAEATLTAEYKAPIVACLPYGIKKKGSLVAVGVSYTGCSPAIAALSVSDEYGNVYTKDINNTGNATGIAFFHTVVTKLPPPGQPFRVKMSTDVSGCPGVAYQVTAIGIAEKQIGSLIGVTAAGWDHDVNNSPNQTLVSGTIPRVPASTWLVGMVAFGPETFQTGITWTPLKGYVIQQQQTFIQFPFIPGNSARIGPGAILAKFADAAGDYDVQVVGKQIGLYAEAGSIALLALTVTLPNPWTVYEA